MNRLVRSEVAPGLEELHIRAESAELSHALLGDALGAAIRDVVVRRVSDTEPRELTAQLRTTRGVAAHLQKKRDARSTAPALREALATYLTCLNAWARSAELSRVLPVERVDGQELTPFELALWLQDDNTGCQTGLVRAADSAVLVFHTEEDTAGYFDAPRVVHMHVAGCVRSAFLYPYLLPGPAFGWHADGAFAYDTLNVQRSTEGGTPTSTLSWLLWWTCGALPAFETAQALTPFLDGGALAVVTRGPGGVSAEQIEVGGACVQRHPLAASPGARHVQVNTVSDAASPLARLELYDADSRAPYCDRLSRASRALTHLGAAVDESRLAAMLGDGEGGEWALANDDVVAHFVGRISATSLSVSVGIGKARGDALFARTWTLP